MAKYTPIKKNISSLSRSEKNQPKISGDTKLRNPREVIMETKRKNVFHNPFNQTSVFIPSVV